MRGGNRSSIFWGGLLLMWIVLAVDYHTLLHHVPLLYIASVVALLGTFLIGKQVFGSAPVDSLGRGLSFTSIGIR